MHNYHYRHVNLISFKGKEKILNILNNTYMYVTYLATPGCINIMQNISIMNICHLLILNLILCLRM